MFVLIRSKSRKRTKFQRRNCCTSSPSICSTQPNAPIEISTFHANFIHIDERTVESALISNVSNCPLDLPRPVSTTAISFPSTPFSSPHSSPNDGFRSTSTFNILHIHQRTIGTSNASIGCTHTECIIDLCTLVTVAGWFDCGLAYVGR